MNIKYLNSAIAGLILVVSGSANAGLIQQWDVNFDELTFHEVTRENDGSSKFGVVAQDKYGSKLTLHTNSWFYLDLKDIIGKKFLRLDEQNSDIILSFDFNANNASPEAAGIQLSNRKNKKRAFNLFGSETWGITDIRYDIDGNAWQHFDINLDQFLSGKSGKIMFFNDCDNCDGKSTVLFRDMKISQVPEPTTLAIFALGLMGLAARRMKKQY